MRRVRVVIRGPVQGVGFRPFVYGLARRLELSGWVRNEGDGVVVEAEGDRDRIAGLLAELARPAPAGGVAVELTVEELPPQGHTGFVIGPSGEQPAAAVFAPPDVATCDACRDELFDPHDRRYGYPFISCAHCGPRLTILDALPYDRTRTSMAGFALCAACRAEYDDPHDRRFHAQTTACPACGPRLALHDATGRYLDEPDPLARVVTALREGRIVAVKGLGGFHLACDATRENVVQELRRRKGREAKPFAVMVPDVESARRLASVSDREHEALTSPARPIVLLSKRPGSPIAAAVAPGSPCLGVMLPYTPLHHLLLSRFGGPLVFTSGNRSDEPIARDDQEAFARLGGIADLFLTHDRPIRFRCDDSVVRVVADEPLPVRRSRGYCPAPIRLPIPCPEPVLATGGHLKCVFGLARQSYAIGGPHVGDLDDLTIETAYRQTLADFERLYQLRPTVLAHDRHPDYATTRYALLRAAENGLKLVGVQHHHAHLASCLAENGRTAPAIGVICDGSGYGDDGTLWGGEFLLGDERGYVRVGHLRPVPLPGGDRAAREPWRVAVAHLLEAGCAPDRFGRQGRVDPAAVRTIARMTERRINSPLTSSMGRLFDAVAALMGLCLNNRYEGQAAAELEALATAGGPLTDEFGLPTEPYPFGIEPSPGPDGFPFHIDPRPLIHEVVDELDRGRPPAHIAARFHRTVAEMIVTGCEVVRHATGLDAVALSGGVFVNAVLLTTAVRRLRDRGFQVYRHRVVPPGDGGLWLGQIVVANAVNRA